MLKIPIVLAVSEGRMLWWLGIRPRRKGSRQMPDESQSAINASLTFAIQDILRESGVEDFKLVAMLAAQAALDRLDQDNYQIVKK
jgi:alpha-D-ribose 1-methylphosphonate 5-triphosphate synthase subunit PhnI